MNRIPILEILSVQDKTVLNISDKEVCDVTHLYVGHDSFIHVT